MIWICILSLYLVIEIGESNFFLRFWIRCYLVGFIDIFGFCFFIIFDYKIIVFCCKYIVFYIIMYISRIVWYYCRIDGNDIKKRDEGKII